MLLRVFFCLLLVVRFVHSFWDLCSYEYVGEYDHVIMDDGRVTSYSDDVIKDALSELAGKVLVTCRKSPVTSSRVMDFYSDVTVKFKQAQFNEGSVAGLEILKEKTWIKNVGFEGCNIRMLDWNHLPQNCTKVFIDNMDQVEFANGDGNDRIRSLKFARVATMDQLPVNLPQYLQQLVIMGESDLNSKLLTKIGSDQHWPPHLSLLYLANTCIRDPNLLTSINSLHHLYMIGNRFNSTDITIDHLPPSLTTLHLQGCQLENIKLTSSHSNLLVVDLSGNRFTNIPQILPPKFVQKLIMSNNKIVQFAPNVFRPFSSITTLFFDHNLLESMPDFLPDNLVELYLAHNKIQFVPPTLFLGKNKLKTVDLSHNKLQFMISNLPSSMERVYMENNELSWVDAQYYEFCVNCRVFNLMYNSLICDEDFIFMLHWFQKNAGNTLMVDDRNCDSNQDIKGYVSLQFLENLSAAYAKANCSYSLNSVECGILYQEKYMVIADIIPPRFLKILKINDNRHVNSFPENMYVDQDNLKVIDFDRNGLVEIPKKLPQNLRVLKLRDNHVTSITKENIRNFEKTSKLKELYLSGNSFKTVYDYQLQHLTHLQVIALDRNQLVCDCDIFSLRNFLDANEVIRHNMQTLYSLQCSAPHKEKGKSFFQFTQDYGGEKCVPDECSYEIYKSTITCPYYNNLTVIPNASYWQVVNLTGSNLRHAALRLTNLSAEVLIVANTSLTRVPARGLPSSLRELYLNCNRISTLPDHDLRGDLPNLKFLDLSYNDIKVIPRSWLNMLSMTSFEGNPLICDCQVLPVYQWTLSNSELVSSNFESLSCGEPEDLRGMKVMELEKDVFCVKTNIQLIVLATLIPIFSILLFSFLTNMYIHKKRRREEREGIIKAFKSLLVSEEVGEDGTMTSYQYDAFISYENNDNKFVTRLLQEMEDVRNRTFCFHERDFKAGKSFSDNIVDLVEQSSRVITIISRNYSKSSWCQYEVQIALTDMHEKRKKKFLIPILLQDVTKDEEVKGSLKTILSVITALSVPSSNLHTSDEWRDFWDKLDSVLP